MRNSEDQIRSSKLARSRSNHITLYVCTIREQARVIQSTFYWLQLARHSGSVPLELRLFDFKLGLNGFSRVPRGFPTVIKVTKGSFHEGSRGLPRLPRGIYHLSVMTGARVIIGCLLYSLCCFADLGCFASFVALLMLLLFATSAIFTASGPNVYGCFCTNCTDCTDCTDCTNFIRFHRTLSSRSWDVELQV